MSNPLKNWKHGKQPQAEELPYKLSLQNPPVLVDGQWKSIYKVNTLNPPNFYGKLFEWENSLYIVKDQFLICDQDLLRDLEYKYRHSMGKHNFLWLFLEIEEDEIFHLLKGMKNRQAAH